MSRRVNAVVRALAEDAAASRVTAADGTVLGRVRQEPPPRAPVARALFLVVSILVNNPATGRDPTFAVEGADGSPVLRLAFGAGQVVSRTRRRPRSACSSTRRGPATPTSSCAVRTGPDGSDGACQPAPPARRAAGGGQRALRAGAGTHPVRRCGPRLCRARLAWTTTAYARRSSPSRSRYARSLPGWPARWSCPSGSTGR